MNFLQKSIAIAVSTCPIVWALPALADAPSISLAQRLGGSTVEECVSSSTQAMQKINLQEVKADSESVSGTAENTRVVIFCNAEKAGLIQTIVVAGVDLDENNRIVEALKGALP
ncbi:MAG: hypothetical protein KME16_15350 [Scytolyngbya sp. HA4215-MV1]|jgi:hypothetical protein|nr:hypothetical protein [Scytolyngbya sp. HA4215-MV1]